MVTVVGVEKRKNKEDKDFNVLILQGDVEVVISKETGRPYLTARKTSIPCTFDESIASRMIGKELPGRIERLQCKDYEYVIPGTKKKLTLSHTYQYSPEPTGIAEVVMG